MVDNSTDNMFGEKRVFFLTFGVQHGVLEGRFIPHQCCLLLLRGQRTHGGQGQPTRQHVIIPVHHASRIVASDNRQYGAAST